MPNERDTIKLLSEFVDWADTEYMILDLPDDCGPSKSEIIGGFLLRKYNLCSLTPREIEARRESFKETQKLIEEHNNDSENS